MLLRFRTDTSVTHPGFKAKYSIGRRDWTKNVLLEDFMDIHPPSGQIEVTFVFVSPQPRVEGPT